MGWRSVWLCFLVLPLIEVQARQGKRFKLSKSFQVEKFSLPLSLFYDPNVNMWIQRIFEASAISAAANTIDRLHPVDVIPSSEPCQHHLQHLGQPALQDVWRRRVPVSRHVRVQPGVRLSQCLPGVLCAHEEEGEPWKPHRQPRGGHHQRALGSPL